MNEPLELRKLSHRAPNGLTKELPSVHQTWLTHREWVAFVPPPTQAQERQTSGLLEQWRERAEFIGEDLDWLLGLQYHQFWSQVVYDRPMHAWMAQMLQGVPREHDLRSEEAEFSQEAGQELKKISKKLFLVFLRMSTHKESRQNHMSLKYFGDLIYNHFIFDIPRLVDLCGLFKPCSPELVRKMISNIFSAQPKYSQDLDQSVVTMVNTLITLTERTEVLTALAACDTDQQLRALVDLVAFAADVCVSVEAFLDAYPEGAKVFHTQGYEQRMAAIYQHVLVVVSKYIVKQKEARLLSQELYTGLASRLQLSRRACVSVLRQIVSVCCVEPALKTSSAQSKEEFAEDFLHITGGCLSEGGTLLVDYDAAHSVQDDFDLFAQSGLELDPMRVQYVIDGVRAQAEEIGVKMDQARKKKQKQQQQVSTGAVPKKKSPMETSYEAEGAGASASPSGVALESLISQVKDLLPDLGPGFVEACLEYFDHNPEKVINAIFEENLPPHLASMSRDKAREAKQAVVEPPKEVKKEEEAKKAETLEQKRRYNVYDGDAYDVNERNDIDQSKVWKGKHSLVAKGNKNANALLNDKAEIRAMKKKFEGLDIISDEVIVAPADSGAAMAGVYDPDYDDEYDDTYDDNAMGEAEPDAKDELTERRPFVLPRALGGGHVNYVKERPEEEEEEEEVDDRERNRKRREFVRNPAEMREEKERKWQEKNNKSKGGRTPNRDLVGKAKGQGQDKQVLINRARKNANKGKQARAGADRKAAKNAF